MNEYDKAYFRRLRKQLEEEYFPFRDILDPPKNRGGFVVKKSLINLLHRTISSPEPETLNELSRELFRCGYPEKDLKKAICPFCMGEGRCTVWGPAESLSLGPEPVEEPVSREESMVESGADLELISPEINPLYPKTWESVLPDGSPVEVLADFSFPNPTEIWYPDWRRLLFSGSTVVAELNGGHSHIIVDDHCYILFNEGKPSSWWFLEALEVLRRLPENPDEAPLFVPGIENE